MFPALLFLASLVNDVRDLIAAKNFAAAERAVRTYQSRTGPTSESAAALSWLARGALSARQFDRAETYAAETRKLSLDLLKTRKLDADPWLPTALGASIEVHAQALAATGQRSEAVAFLNQQIAAYSTTSIGERIRKNLNLLSMEGKPAPPLDITESIGPKPVTLASLRGRTVLLFFWAHWCPDCKAEAPILASLMRMYGSKGLTVIAPTKRYGYIAGGEDAAPVVEKRYIEKIREQYYPAMLGMSTPLDARNFLSYGCSTTPTIVLIDSTGVVRLYHPGALSEQELTAHVQKIVGR